VRVGLAGHPEDGRWSSCNEYAGKSADKHKRRCGLIVEPVRMPLNPADEQKARLLPELRKDLNEHTAQTETSAEFPVVADAASNAVQLARREIASADWYDSVSTPHWRPNRHASL
jgi:hypothetical protein